MQTLRDLLLCGPAAVLLAILLEAGAGLTTAAGSSLLLYALLRLLAAQAGFDQKLDENRRVKRATRLARQAMKEAATRVGDRRR